MGEDGKGSRVLQRYLCDGSCFSPPPPQTSHEGWKGTRSGKHKACDGRDIGNEWGLWRGFDGRYLWDDRS